MTKNYDVIFIGSGHAAWHAALALRHAKKTVAIIEKEKIAGTCTNYGCNPKILLEAPFEALEISRQLGDIISEQPKVNWTKLMDYKHQVIDPLSGGLEHIFKQQGIDIIKGTGVFKDEHTVTVEDTDYYADYIVIATGQRSHQLDVPGKEYTNDSSAFMELQTFPKRIAFLGGGYISIEFASIAAKMGAEVSVINHSDKVLKPFHQPHVKKLVHELEQQGVCFFYNEDVAAITKQNDTLTISTKQGTTIETDYIVDATGRIPNVENIGIETIGIDFNSKGIKVNNHMQTNIKHIYASGDVVDKSVPKLTPTATFESNYIALQIIGHDATLKQLPMKALKLMPIKYPAIPSVVYTFPRLAQIGVPIHEAEQDKKYTVKTINFGEQLEFQYKGETDAELVIVLDKKNHLVGAAIYGNDAPELINILTFIIDKKLSAKDLNTMIFAFPSASSGILQMLGMQMLGVDIDF